MIATITSRRPRTLPTGLPQTEHTATLAAPGWLGMAGQPPQPGRDEVWAAYIRATTAAEDDLRSRDLDWTILRPGRLNDAPGTGRIRLAPPPVPCGTIPRADVAAVIAALLDEPGTRHQTLGLVRGRPPGRGGRAQHFLTSAGPRPPTSAHECAFRLSGPKWEQSRQLQMRTSRPRSHDIG
jgi:hypothetical protein